MNDIDKLMELINKKTKIMELIDEIHNPLILEYFDIESDKNLDKKIKVLEEVKNGKDFSDIDGFWDILELYPSENVEI